MTSKIQPYMHIISFRCDAYISLLRSHFISSTKTVTYTKRKCHKKPKIRSISSCHGQAIYLNQWLRWFGFHNNSILHIYLNTNGSFWIRTAKTCKTGKHSWFSIWFDVNSDFFSLKDVLQSVMKLIKPEKPNWVTKLIKNMMDKQAQSRRSR